MIYKVRNKKTGKFLNTSGYVGAYFVRHGGKVWKRKSDLSLSLSEGFLSREKLRSSGINPSDLEIVTFELVEQEVLQLSWPPMCDKCQRTKKNCICRPM